MAAEAPLSSEQQDAIDRYVVAEMARERIPGLEVDIYPNGHAIYARGYGIASLEGQVPSTRTPA